MNNFKIRKLIIILKVILKVNKYILLFIILFKKYLF